jgi:hypothetical protein
MLSVRRTLGTAGLAGFLLLVPAGSAWAADPTPTPDPSATASASAAPSTSPDATPSPAASPTEAPAPTEEPAPSGCEENPVICESGGPQVTPTDCGLPPNEGIAVGEPAPGTNPDGTPGSDPGTSEPGSPKPEPSNDGARTADEPADPDQVFCIASGVGNAGGAPQAPGEGAILDKEEVAQLPRTGPAPLLPTAAVGAWLLLLGVVAGLAGRRPTDQLRGI